LPALAVPASRRCVADHRSPVSSDRETFCDLAPSLVSSLASRKAREKPSGPAPLFSFFRPPRTSFYHSSTLSGPLKEDCGRHAGHEPPAIFKSFLSQPATSELLPSFLLPQTSWTTIQTPSAFRPGAGPAAFSWSFPRAMAMQNAPAGPQSSKPPAPSTWRFAPARLGSPLPTRRLPSDA